MVSRGKKARPTLALLGAAGHLARVRRPKRETTSPSPGVGSLPERQRRSDGCPNMGPGGRELPGLADLPMGVAVPVRPGRAGAVTIPRPLTARELAALTNTNANIEFAVTWHPVHGYRLTRASFAVPNRVELSLDPGTRWLAHTHPLGYATVPSTLDYDVLRYFRQQASRLVLPTGSSLRFELPAP